MSFENNEKIYESHEFTNGELVSYCKNGSKESRDGLFIGTKIIGNLLYNSFFPIKENIESKEGVLIILNVPYNGKGKIKKIDEEKALSIKESIDTEKLEQFMLIVNDCGNSYYNIPKRENGVLRGIRGAKTRIIKRSAGKTNELNPKSLELLPKKLVDKLKSQTQKSETLANEMYYEDENFGEKCLEFRSGNSSSKIKEGKKESISRVKEKIIECSKSTEEKKEKSLKDKYVDLVKYFTKDVLLKFYLNKDFRNDEKLNSDQAIEAITNHDWSSSQSRVNFLSRQTEKLEWLKSFKEQQLNNVYYGKNLGDLLKSRNLYFKEIDKVMASFLQKEITSEVDAKKAITDWEKNKSGLLIELSEYKNKGELLEKNTKKGLFSFLYHQTFSYVDIFSLRLKKSLDNKKSAVKNQKVENKQSWLNIFFG